MSAGPASLGRGTSTTPSEQTLTLTDATVAVARYLKMVRKRRLGFEELFVPPALERDFVRAAAVFGKAHGIHYATWREFGVEYDVLRRAGITRRHRQR